MSKIKARNLQFSREIFSRKRNAKIIRSRKIIGFNFTRTISIVKPRIPTVKIVNMGNSTPLLCFKRLTRPRCWDTGIFHSRKRREICAKTTSEIDNIRKLYMYLNLNDILTSKTQVQTFLKTSTNISITNLVIFPFPVLVFPIIYHPNQYKKNPE